MPPSDQVAVQLHHQPHLPELLLHQLPGSIATGGPAWANETHVTSLTEEDAVTPENVVSSTFVPFATTGIPPRIARNNSLRSDVFCPLPLLAASPINIDILDNLLSGHPDRSLVSYVVEGFRFGFDIGFEGSLSATRPRNLLSARSNPSPVSEEIFKEVQRGHTSGLFDVPPILPFHCFPLGAVP